MKFYTKEAVQELANKSGKAVCAWIPCTGGFPVPKDEFRYVVDPSGRVRDYELPAAKGEPVVTRHSITQVFRPHKP